MSSSTTGKTSLEFLWFGGKIFFISIPISGELLAAFLVMVLLSCSGVILGDNLLADSFPRQFSFARHKSIFVKLKIWILFSTFLFLGRLLLNYRFCNSRYNLFIIDHESHDSWSFVWRSPSYSSAKFYEFTFSGIQVPPSSTCCGIHRPPPSSSSLHGFSLWTILAPKKWWPIKTSMILLISLLFYAILMLWRIGITSFWVSLCHLLLE